VIRAFALLWCFALVAFGEGGGEFAALTWARKFALFES
jgi:hypothetical protein